MALAVVLGIGIGLQGAEHPTPVALANAYRLLVGIELFLLLVLAPLADGATRPGRRVGLLQLFLLLVMAAPAVVVAAWMAGAEEASVAASQAYLLAAAALVSGYVRLDRDGRLRGLYWLLVAALGGGVPMVAFVVGDLVRLPLTWLYALSPFWVADRLSQPWQFGRDWAVAFAAMLVVAAILHACSRAAARPPSR